MYVYIYIYIHTYIHIYIYTCIYYLVNQDGEDGAHAVVVVLLRRELLGAERVRGDDLHRQGPRVLMSLLCVCMYICIYIYNVYVYIYVLVAEGVELDLADHGVVRNHHRHRAEKRLRCDVYSCRSSCRLTASGKNKCPCHVQYSTTCLEASTTRPPFLGVSRN